MEHKKQTEAGSPARRREQWTRWLDRRGRGGAGGEQTGLEGKAVGRAEFSNVEKGGGNENDQAGILGLGMVLPVTEPSRELYTWMTPPKSGPGGWIRADMEGRRSTRYRATPDDKYSASGQGPLLLGV